MLLAIDVGNTNVVLGVYQGKKLISNFRIKTDIKKTADDYGILICSLLEKQKINLEIEGIIICSVVPPLMRAFSELAKKYFKKELIVIDKNVKSKVKILYEAPEEVGADRLVNAIATYELYGGPSIVVDFGTATTFDVISKKGEYLGGAISPGINTSLEALFRETAKLPKIEFKKPKNVIGKNTQESMQSGAFYGFISLTEGMIKRIEEELKEKTFVVATGGLAELFLREIKIINEINPLLTLEGLRIIYENY
jgi:type III pantothenate kinase